ncbi:hypothetical protein BaRGS_00010047, partial [Batillaria attramentaria]
VCYTIVALSRAPVSSFSATATDSASSDQVTPLPFRKLTEQERGVTDSEAAECSWRSTTTGFVCCQEERNPKPTDPEQCKRDLCAFKSEEIGEAKVTAEQPHRSRYAKFANKIAIRMNYEVGSSYNSSRPQADMTEHDWVLCLTYQCLHGPEPEYLK